MYSFTYHRPKSLSEAKSMLGGAEDGKLLAGGQTLLPTMKQRLAMPSDLVDLGQVAELQGIEVTGDAVVIGAGVRHADVASSAEVRKAIPALADLASHIGDPHVRHRGTLGGSVANNDPAADYPGAVLGLGATVHTDARQIAADDFFKGIFETALEDGEIVTKISFPIPAKAAYAKFPNPASRYSLVGAFVAQMKDGSVRVAITGAGANGVFRVAEMEKALASNFSADAIANVKVSPDDVNGDIHGSPEYRAHLVTVMAKRAVAAAG